MEKAQKISLCLIDDETDFLSLTDIFLKKLNPYYEIRKFHSPKECLEYIETAGERDEGPDIIISDYEMPEMNGLELLGEVKKLIDIPFIMVSGKAREEIVIEALNKGVDFFLQKSVTADSLYRELDNLIQIAFEKISMTEEITELKEFYESLVNLSPEGILIHVNQIIKYVNPALLEMLEYDGDNDLIGRNILDVIVHPDYHKKIKKRLKNSLAGIKTPFITAKFRKADGSTIEISGTGRLLRYKGEQSIIVFIRDLTDQPK